MKNYSDIIDLSHHISKRHPQMSRESRAAQFAPFAALVGYADAIQEAARTTDYKIELDDGVKSVINEKLNFINIHISERPQVTFTYFVPDKIKDGGSYESITCNVRRIDMVNNIIVLTNKMKIEISSIVNISGI